jgi:cell division transport system permease protein
MKLRHKNLAAPPALPLAHDRNVRPLRWILAMLIFLAALAMVIQSGLHLVAARWSQQTGGTLTIEITPAADADNNTTQQQVAMVLGDVQATPGVTKASIISRDEVANLLQPWLGSAALNTLPLPTLIDVELAPNTPLNAAELQKIINKNNTRVEDRGAWLDDLAGFAKLLQLVALVAAGLAIGALALAVIYACRAGLAMHQDIITLLHIMGASDRAVAAEFERFIRRIIIPASLIGAGICAVIIAGFIGAAWSFDLAQFQPAHLGAGQWLYLILSLLVIPLLASGIAVIAARISVLQNLRAMP